MVLLPFFDIPSGFQLAKITEECPFQGPVFFGLIDSARWNDVKVEIQGPPYLFGHFSSL